MKEHPILFSAPMVRSILDGRKTQTRRIVKGVDGNSWIRIEGGYGMHIVDERALGRCPYGVPGDRLWCRETWQMVDPVSEGVAEDQLGSTAPFMGVRGGRRITWRAVYAADGDVVCGRRRGDVPVGARLRWRPSIHMPRWASRITLEVTDVRVERLNDISEADAMDEGALQRRIESEARGSTTTDDVPKASAEFQRLWESINGPGAWRANPWVWAITFKRVTP